MTSIFPAKPPFHRKDIFVGDELRIEGPIPSNELLLRSISKIGNTPLEQLRAIILQKTACLFVRLNDSSLTIGDHDCLTRFKNQAAVFFFGPSPRRSRRPCPAAPF